MQLFLGCKRCRWFIEDDEPGAMMDSARDLTICFCAAPESRPLPLGRHGNSSIGGAVGQRYTYRAAGHVFFASQDDVLCHCHGRNQAGFLIDHDYARLERVGGRRKSLLLAVKQNIAR